MGRNYLCMFEACNKRGFSRGYCKNHYEIMRQRGTFGSPTCCVNGCTKVIKAKNYCAMHYHRIVKTGNPGEIGTIKRSDGEGTITRGYKVIYVNGKRYLEHRYIMEQFIGRPLFKYETVHHKNGNRLDNYITNLELWSKSQPAGQRIEDKLNWAKQIISEYETLTQKFTQVQS